MDIRENFFSGRVIRQRLRREVVESPPVEMFMKGVDVALRDVVSGLVGMSWGWTR